MSAKIAFRDALGVSPTHIVMDQQVADKISIQAEIRDIVKYILAGGASLDKSLIALPGSGGALPSRLQDMEVCLAGSYYNSANPAQTRVITRVWGKDVYLVYVDPTPSIESATWMRTFMYENLSMYTYTVPGRRGRYVEGFWTLDEKECLSSAIYKIVAAIS